MITDQETNAHYLADTLPVRHPGFFARFSQVLNDLDIPVTLINGTADIWARDYMPVQVAKDRFVQFLYQPDYLQSGKWPTTITDVDRVVAEMGLRVEKSSIKLDGGNVIRSKDKVILCDKVFKENPGIPPGELIRQLERLFNVSRVIIIPAAKGDFIGHADGYVRFLDEKTVLVNDYGPEDGEYSEALLTVLEAADLECIPIPYNPYRNRFWLDATGVYINYLKMQQGIILSAYGQREDELAFKQFERLFQGVSIRTVMSKEVAREGGVLNCISWNVPYLKPFIQLELSSGKKM